MRLLAVAALWLSYSMVHGGGSFSVQRDLSNAAEKRPAVLATVQHGVEGAFAVRRVLVGTAQNELPREQFRAAKASAVLLDWRTGRVLATVGEERAAAPGSILKPFLLAYGLQHSIVAANTRVYCRRTLRVADTSLSCTHPNDQPLLDAEGALAESCNTWFAALARRMGSNDLSAVLRQAGLTHSATQFADADTRVLTALGIKNVSATPMQIAMAYRALLVQESHTGVVWKGLQDSVVYGMANKARVDGVDIMGKTGTASNAGEWWTHGWFAGGVPGRFVLVVYVPHGDGGTAATLAGASIRQLLREGGR